MTMLMTEGRQEGAIGIGDELIERLERAEHVEDRFAAAVQLFGLGRGEETVEVLGALLEAPVGEYRTRAAAQLSRIGLPAMRAYRSLVRAALNREDDGLSLTAVETLNSLDPQNLVGAPQMVRLLRRRVLRMWKGGAFLRVSAEDGLLLRLVRALAVNGRFHDDGRYELEHLAVTTSGRVQAMALEALDAFDPPEETEAERPG